MILISLGGLIPFFSTKFLVELRTNDIGWNGSDFYCVIKLINILVIEKGLGNSRFFGILHFAIMFMAIQHLRRVFTGEPIY